MAYLNPEMCTLLSQEVIDNLNFKDIWTINDLLSTKNLMYLKQGTNIRFNSLKEIYDRIDQRYTLSKHDLNFMLDKRIETLKICSTGLADLDDVLGGGLKSQEIVEYYGESETGKTELCYLVCGVFLKQFQDYSILYIASNHDFDPQKIIKNIQNIECDKKLSEDDIYNYLNRIHLARPTKLADLVHLLNTSIHNDKRNSLKLIILDSISFIIQDIILSIKSLDLNDGDEVDKFVYLKNICYNDIRATINSERKYLLDVYLHEVMKLLTQITLAKNLILLVTNSDSNLTFNKSWINAINHRIYLARLPNNSGSTFSATITKTTHNITYIGYSIPFLIDDNSIRYASKEIVSQTQTKSINN